MGGAIAGASGRHETLFQFFICRVLDIYTMNTRKFDYNLLVIFEAVLKEGSVSAAADAIGLTQPAVSSSLARLRAIVGDPLFIRTNRGMQPTPRALALSTPVIKALKEIRESLLQPDTFDPATSQRTFSILMQDVGELVFLPPLLAHIGKHAPGIKISVPQTATKDHAEALITGAVDLAAGYLPHLKVPFQQAPLFTARFACLVRKGHPVIKDRITMRQFVSTPHAVVSRQGSLILDRLLSQRSIAINAAVKVEHFSAVPAIVSQTDMIAIMPSELAANYARTGGYRSLALPFPSPSIEIRQYWHQRNHQDPGVSWLRETMETLFLDGKSRSRARRK